MRPALALIPPAPALHPAFLAAVQDDATAQAVRQAARELGWPSSAVVPGGMETAEAQPLRPGLPRLLVLDLDGEADPAAAVTRIVARLGGGSRIVALGSANDIGLYRKLVAAGAADYLVKPITLDMLRAAFAPPQAAAPAVKAAHQGKVVAVIGVRGGVGASTIATNMAWLMAHEVGRTTALLDLDLQFGTAALALDLEPGRGLREVLAVPDRLDPLLLTACMVAESPRLSVIATEEGMEEGVQYEPQALVALLRELRSGFESIVIDMPRHLVPRHRQLLGAVDSVVLVSDLSLAGIRDTVRVRQAIQPRAGQGGRDGEAGGTVAIFTVASRVGKDRKAQVEPDIFVKGTHAPLAAVLPEDARSMTTAANQGKALGAVAKSAPVTAALLNLTRKAFDAEPVPQPGLMAKLFRRTR